VSKHIAVYPGSFDPMTYGHVDIIERSAEVFEEVVVLVAINSGKDPLFSTEERIALINEIFSDNPRIKVDTFDGLLVDYMRAKEIRVVVRGLRAVSDFEYEFQMAQINRKMHSDSETFFMAASANYSYISSRIVKEVFSLGACVEELAPAPVVAAMRKKFNLTK
jgi:pantetheine-phosphate adenylyltransferase